MTHIQVSIFYDFKARAIYRLRKKALFLGYNVSVRRNNVIKQNGQGYKQRTLNNKVELTVPFERIEKFMFDRGIIRQTESKKFKLIHRKGWLYLPDYVIVQRYNEEMRGVLNYYNLAVDYNRLGYFRYLMEYSCLATLAGKHNSSISKIARKHCKGKYWSVPYITSSGVEKEIRLVTLKDCQKGKCNGNHKTSLYPCDKCKHKSKACNRYM